MSAHIQKLVRAFESLPVNFSEDDLDRVIVDALDGVPLDDWESIADAACDHYCNQWRDRVTLFLANFNGTMH